MPTDLVSGSRPWADTVLVGPVSTAQLETNLAATEVDLAADDMDALSRLSVPPERYWAERGAPMEVRGFEPGGSWHD